MYDIVNRSQNINLPVVALDATNIQRTPERVLNKHDNFYYNNALTTTPGTITRHRTPIPIRVSLNMSILAGYQLDLEQIASNFIAYFNPYIILSTKVPSDLGPEYDLEVRTKAQWNGNLNISTPIDLSYADKFRRTGDTVFILDSWIYPELIDNVKPIYFIDANFYSINQKILDVSSYYVLSGGTYTLSTYPRSIQGVDTISLSGTPTITNIFYASSGKNIPIDSNIIFEGETSRDILLYGYNYNRLDYVLLSAADTSLYGPLTSLPSTYYGTVSGCILNRDQYVVFNDNMLQVTIPYFSSLGGNFNIVTYNSAGWDDTSSKIIMFWTSSSNISLESGFDYLVTENNELLLLE